MTLIKDSFLQEAAPRLRDSTLGTMLESDRSIRRISHTLDTTVQLQERMMMQIWPDRSQFQENRLALLQMYRNLLSSHQNPQIGSRATIAIRALQSPYRPLQYFPMMILERKTLRTW